MSHKILKKIFFYVDFIKRQTVCHEREKIYAEFKIKLEMHKTVIRRKPKLVRKWTTLVPTVAKFTKIMTSKIQVLLLNKKKIFFQTCIFDDNLHY